jgi:hypothetical protein
MDNTRVFRVAFASVCPHYIAEAEKKGRTKEDVHAIIHWLTGYDEAYVEINSPDSFQKRRFPGSCRGRALHVLVNTLALPEAKC